MITFKEKLITVLITLLLLLICNSCSERNEVKILVTNQTNHSLTDVFIEVGINRELKSFSLHDGETVIPYQVFVSGDNNELYFVLNMSPQETKMIKIKEHSNEQAKEFKSRTYAELSMKPGNIYVDGKFRGDKFLNVTNIKVPEIHTDHDALFKYEGPGWESEKVGYRFYLDWRNANDIFGKKVSLLVLANVGIHDTVAKDDSYHEMQDWGMDMFKVGNSLGIGSIGMWHENRVFMVSKTDSVFCEILNNGPIKSSVKTAYYGWQIGDEKYDLVSTLSITAGTRFSKCEIEISNDPENIVTGLAKYEGTDFIRNNGKREWAYVALYGNQTLVDPEDKLGIAIFYQRRNLLEVTEDELNHVVKLKPENKKLEYYFCAAWEKEPDGIKTRNEFIKYLDDMVELFDYPPIVKME